MGGDVSSSPSPSPSPTPSPSPSAGSPPAVGQRLILQVVDIGFGGEGVARIDDFVVFVPFVLPGEEVEAEIVEVKKQFARARLRRVHRAAPERVTPLCPYFGECGGCQYQHMDYDRQRAVKRKQVVDLLERVGGFRGVTVDEVVPCPQPYHYRNRIMVRSWWNKQRQALDIGFLRADSRIVVDVAECRIAEPELNAQLQEVRAHPPHKGGLKVVLRRIPPGWSVPPDSFFQNNSFLLPRLIETVRDRLQAGGVRHLIDAYCGVGFFGIELAPALESFVGVEVDRQAIKAARTNAEARGVRNGQFVEGRAELLLPELLKRFERSKTGVLIDPPRTGCPPIALEALRTQRPRQVLYVSCHPATLARDLNVLCADGVFGLVRVTPLDMFPQTQHVECVADVRLAAAAE
jgi:tRNA/tmRNA/rRNA uracil-C5-methylase (TrmA/RlmC/RlmD family)